MQLPSAAKYSPFLYCDPLLYSLLSYCILRPSVNDNIGKVPDHTNDHDVVKVWDLENYHDGVKVCDYENDHDGVKVCYHENDHDVVT